MTTQVNIHEAKTHLSRLLEAVERGEEVIIARAGKPIATISAYKPQRKKLLPPGSGKLAGMSVPDDFDEPMDDLFDALIGRDEPWDRSEPEDR